MSSNPPNTRAFKLACPQCREPLAVQGKTAYCALCGRDYFEQNGIWHFLPPARVKSFEKLLQEYCLLRAAEGWGAGDASYYRALPQVASDDPQRAIWRIVAKNFTRLLTLLAELQPQQILDNGAGNGWVSYQLARRGYTVAAIDLSDDARDGLGASVHYDHAFECYQAEFDHLPFQANEFDVVLFSGSLHYSTDLPRTLREAGRVLRPNGAIVILASPLFRLRDSGTAMVADREKNFHARFGYEQAARVTSFFTESQLEQAASEVGMRVWFLHSDNHWLKRLRRAWIQRKSGREPARFPLIVMQNFEKKGEKEEDMHK